MRAIASAMLVATAMPAFAESAIVKYREPPDPIDLALFACRENPRPSFVKRTCYDAKERYMLILLKQTWYHYCELGEATYAAFTGEKHMGRYYLDHIKGSGKDGPFDCRTHRMPSYK